MMNRTLTAKVERRRLVAGATALMATGRTAETVVDGVDVLAAGWIVDAEDAVEGRVAAGGIADAAGRVGEDTRTSTPRIYTDSLGW